MTTQQIIETLNGFTPFSDDDSENDNESFFYNPMQELRGKKDFEIAIGPIFRLIEKYPSANFGSPGPFVHTLETFTGFYEKYLFESLNRKPTPLTVWMFNRIINGERNSLIKSILVDRLGALLTHPDLDEVTIESINDFIAFQLRNK